MTAGKEVWVQADGPTGADVKIWLDDQQIKGVISADIDMSVDNMNRLTITVMGTIADVKAVMMLPIQLVCPACSRSIDHDCEEFKRDTGTSGISPSFPLGGTP
jgi:hypothetical protein